MITLPFKKGQIQSQEFGFTEFAKSPAGVRAYGVGRPHEGTDLYSIEDSTVCSISDGTVIVDNDSYNGSNSGLFASYGNFVVIKDNDSDRAWYYCHLDSNKVNVGQKVKAGEPIGIMGGSGSGSRSMWGPHLHLGRATLDKNNSRTNKSSISYGFIDGADDLKKAIDKFNNQNQVANDNPSFEKSYEVLSKSNKLNHQFFIQNPVIKNAFTSSKDLGYIAQEFIWRDETFDKLENDWKNKNLESEKQLKELQLANDNLVNDKLKVYKKNVELEAKIKELEVKVNSTPITAIEPKENFDWNKILVGLFKQRIPQSALLFIANSMAFYGAKYGLELDSNTLLVLMTGQITTTIIPMLSGFIEGVIKKLKK